MAAFKDIWPRKTSRGGRSPFVHHRVNRFFGSFRRTLGHNFRYFTFHNIICRFHAVKKREILSRISWLNSQKLMEVFFVFCFFFVKAAELPFKVPSAPPRLRLPLSKTAVPVATSCRCHTPAAWWTCKQHGHSYIFPSGRLGAVFTILFTLWIPRTRSRPAPLF